MLMMLLRGCCTFASEDILTEHSSTCGIQAGLRHRRTDLVYNSISQVLILQTEDAEASCIMS